MYSVVLMAALATGTTAPDCHYHSGYSCCGGYSYGCCGGYSYGCCGGYSYGCCGGYYYGGCYGSYSYGCAGCCGGTPYHLLPYGPAAPVTPAPPEKVPAPKPEDPKPDAPKKDGAMAPNVGRMVVEVPVDAKLFIDGQLMKTSTERRSFRTPELVPGQQYFYDLRAEVTIDGKTEVETQRVVIQGGATAQASFPKLVAAVEASKALAASK